MTLAFVSVAGLGIDFVDIGPLRRSLARYGNRILRHVFTSDEIRKGLENKDAARFFAECFAVKEAAFKALGTGWAGALRWQDVERNATRLVIGGEFKRRVETTGVTAAHVSVSSTNSIACAVVVLSSMIDPA